MVIKIFVYNILMKTILTAWVSEVVIRPSDLGQDTIGPSRPNHGQYGQKHLDGYNHVW